VFAGDFTLPAALAIAGKGERIADGVNARRLTPWSLGRIRNS
jgi:hypothetical protein